jgi:hypothetical protein
VLKRIAYQDLYVNLETIWKYVSYYKNCTVTNPTLVNPGRIAVRLFYRDGSVVNTSASRIAIRDVSYIQLVGSGKLTKLEIEGFSLTQ